MSTTSPGDNVIPPRSVSEISPQYRHFFSSFVQFNLTQSTAFDDVYNSDADLVVSAPTGAGKTVVFELALIRMLQRMQPGGTGKAVYMSPTRALCDERYQEWQNYLKPLRLGCMLLTGDLAGDYNDALNEIERANVIVTTPEKWDSMTRRWRDADHTLTKHIRLFMIDEVHLLGEDERGATLEIIVSRMKTIRASMTNRDFRAGEQPLRFVAVSATVPNIEDVARWIGRSEGDVCRYGNAGMAKFHVIDPNKRPVKLNCIVKGFPWNGDFQLFKFDLNLNYRLPEFIQMYSDGQPTLIFCSTRVSAEQCATILSQKFRIRLSDDQKRFIANTYIQNEKLQPLIMHGIGFHHAALLDTDRQAVEQLFRGGHLPVLVSTSTLSMGVNLPAHLVIIKSTVQLFASAGSKKAGNDTARSAHDAQKPQEYSITQIQQMIGRAGRPQFDQNGAVALILTRTSTEDRYKQMLSNGNFIESVLHNHMTEHVNAEIVLKTFSTLSMMLTWLKSTFFYVRLLQNPHYYGFDQKLLSTTASTSNSDVVTIKQQSVDSFLIGLCRRYLDTLAAAGVIDMEDPKDQVKSADSCRFLANQQGIIMARHYVSLDTMRILIQLEGDLSLQRLLEAISHAHEFDDARLRHTEKGALNALNRTMPTKKTAAGAPAAKKTVRYPLPGRVQTTAQKANLLVQATLGCLGSVEEKGDQQHHIALEGALKQDVLKIFRALQRIGPCMLAHLRQRWHTASTNPDAANMYHTMVSACLLSKCFHAKLWENSPHKLRQLNGIGEKLSTRLVEHGMSEFKNICAANPRNLEVVLMKKPPFGDHLVEQVRRVPDYLLHVQCATAKNNATIAASTIGVAVKLENWSIINDYATDGRSQQRRRQRQTAFHFVHLIVGDNNNRLYCCERISDADLIKIHRAAADGEVDNYYKRLIKLPKKLGAPETSVIYAHIISERWVGIDKCVEFRLVDEVCKDLSQCTDDIRAMTMPENMPSTVSASATTSSKPKTPQKRRGGITSTALNKTPPKRARGGTTTPSPNKTCARPTDRPLNALIELLDADNDADNTINASIAPSENDLAVDNQHLDWLAQRDFDDDDVDGLNNGDGDMEINSQMFQEIFESPNTASNESKKEPERIIIPALAVSIDDSDDDDDDCEARRAAAGATSPSEAVDDYARRVAEADEIHIYRPFLDGLLKRFGLI